MADELRIIMAAGGTGGHVFPAIAIADAIREQYPSARFLFVGTRDRMEWKAVPAAGYDITPVWISGFHRRLTLKNLLFPLKLLVSLWQSRSLIRRFRPHALVSCGGFAAGPAGWMAARQRVPVFLQEQNSYPGVTNRKLAPHAELIFTAFEEAGRWFPADRTVCAGNPVRQSLMERLRDSSFVRNAKAHFDFDPGKPVLLLMGGSGGAKSINEAVFKNLDALLDMDGLQIIWQCGEHYLQEIRLRLEREYGIGERQGQQAGLRLFGFMDDVAEAWAAADTVVARAGAITCSELMVTGKAGILVPSPWVAGDHQTKNAEALAGKGAAMLLKDDRLADELPVAVRSLIMNPGKRLEMEKKIAGLARPNAAREIASLILNRIRPAETPITKTRATA
ncbi:undecaprenyldiphospho-muramoylpentapeptide beta-N-acetylglucosaminyltransferase [Balneolales bacterium ANBcel1]|nr:undecaprenyldiphospho-muramoylpentapeptide beta-N-acetylglucosaminyltransferase [Balneolales bacterium ANBcel1]